MGERQKSLLSYKMKNNNNNTKNNGFPLSGATQNTQNSCVIFKP